MKRTVVLSLSIVAFALVLPVPAADWPQWQGPDRTNVSRETGLLKDWSKDGPKLLWTFENAGVGFSGPAIVGDRLFTLGARSGKEMLFALNTKDGAEVWAVEVGNLFVNGYGDGPRCTPTVESGKVYAIGGQGDLICADANSGKKVWQKNMRKDFGGDMMSGWGYTESPLVDGDRLICTPGGGKGTFAALNKSNGQVIWRSTGLTDKAAYSSIIVADVGGTKQYINMTGAGEAGVAAKDGKLLWKADSAKNGTAIIPTPIYSDSQVFVTSGYGAGCALLKLTGNAAGFKADVAYSNKNLANHHGGVVLVNGNIYGHSDSKGWVCLDLKTGDTKWAERSKLGKGSVTCVDGVLYCYTEREGTCVLVDAATDGWKEHGRFKIPRETKLPRKSGQIWTHPVVANGRLYLRDQDLIFCFDVQGK